MDKKVMSLLGIKDKYPQKLRKAESLNIDFLTKYLISNDYDISNNIEWEVENGEMNK